MTEPSTPVGWFRFPPEIRNVIYRELMPVCNPPATIAYGRIAVNCLWLVRTGPRRSLAILRTNKRVHAEASSILYGDSVIDLSELEYHSFASSGLCSPQNARLIRRVAFGYPRWIHYTTYLPGSGNLLLSSDTYPLHFCPALFLAGLRLCFGLREITFRAPSIWATIGEPNDIDQTIQALIRFNRHLRQAFPDLERISVEVLRSAWPLRSKDRDAAIKMKDAMRQVGWVLMETDKIKRR